MTPRTTQPLGEVNVAEQMASVNESVCAPAICVPGKKNKFLKPFFQQKPDKMIVVVLFKYSELISRARSKKTIGRFEIILRTIVAAL